MHLIPVLSIAFRRLLNEIIASNFIFISWNLKIIGYQFCWWHINQYITDYSDVLKMHQFYIFCFVKSTTISMGFCCCSNSFSKHWKLFHLMEALNSLKNLLKRNFAIIKSSFIQFFNNYSMFYLSQSILTILWGNRCNWNYSPEKKIDISRI